MTDEDLMLRGKLARQSTDKDMAEKLAGVEDWAYYVAVYDTICDHPHKANGDDLVATALAFYKALKGD